MIEILDIFLQLSEQAGYTGIIFLMAIESSFIPFPSEAIIPPAAYLASQGQMNVYLIIIFGTLGSLIGAVVNYFLAFYLGRTIIYRIAGHKMSKCLLINCKKVEKAENFFLKYGGISTLLGRLVPVVRQLISLPAGFAKMKFLKFAILTSLGSSVWVSILAFLGYFFGANQNTFSQYYKQIILFIVIIILLILAIWTLRYFRKKNKNKTI